MRVDIRLHSALPGRADRRSSWWIQPASEAGERRGSNAGRIRTPPDPSRGSFAAERRRDGRRTRRPVGEGRSFMGWQANEVWFDADVRWFREQPRKPFGALAVDVPAFAATAFGPPLSIPIATGLEASRQRRAATQAARRRRLATRQVPAAALVLGSATMLAISALRNGDGEHAGPLQEDPPSLTFRFGLEGSGLLEPPLPRKQSSSAATGRRRRRVAPRQVRRPSLFRASRRRHPTSSRRG